MGGIAGKTLIIGASGLVGSRILARLGDAARGTYCSHPRPGLELVDITVADTVEDEIEAFRPAVVVLAAAYTHVDGCETDPARSYDINVAGTRNVARTAARYGARLVFLSTDYVFDGEHGPHALDEAPAPMNIYGHHKLEAEHIVASELASYAILRSCNIYGFDATGKNFVMAVYRNGISRTPMRVPIDQWGNPTYADDLVDAVVRAGELQTSGVFHVAGPDYVDRLAWARQAATAFGLDGSFIEGVPTSELRQPARRPFRAGLDSRASTAALGITMRGLDAGLALVCKGIEASRHHST
jgi:dTDP-4-dehydrorhamnose reductase